MRLPYRIELKGTADASTMDLLYRILEARVHRWSLPDLPEIIETANELVLWELVGLLRDESPDLYNVGAFPSAFSRLRLVAKLIDRAIRDADAEGVIWTPILDVLAETQSWFDITAQRQHLQDVAVPTPKERAQRLVPWISNATDPAALRGLARFRSSVILTLLAQHAPVFDEETLSSLPHFPWLANVLVTNPAFDAKAAQFLIRRAYEAWKESQAEATNPHSVNQHDLVQWRGNFLLMLLKEGHPLPPDIRADILDLIQQRPSDGALWLTQFLLSDPSTPMEILRQVPDSLLDAVASSALAHPNCPPETWERLANNNHDLDSALQRYQLPPERLARVYERCLQSGRNPRILAGIAHQQNATPEMWLAALANQDPSERGKILVALASNPKARQQPDIRAALLASVGAAAPAARGHAKKGSALERGLAIEVITQLLEDRRPEEFEPLMLSYYRRDSNAALDHLQKDGIPAGAPFPTRLFARILGSRNNQHRLSAITMLAELKAAGQISDHFEIPGAIETADDPNANQSEEQAATARNSRQLPDSARPTP